MMKNVRLILHEFHFGQGGRDVGCLMMKNVRLILHPKLQWLRNVVCVLVYGLVACLRPVKADSIILATNRRAYLSDNLRWIYEELDKDLYSVRVMFVEDSHTPRRVISDLRFITAMAQTQVTIVDDFLPVVYPVKLRPGTRLVQVWHALGALKRVGYSRGGKHGGPIASSISHKNYTDVIVSADSIRQDFASAFGVPLAVVHATGAPRSDLFFNADKQKSALARLYQAVPQVRGRRVILFAPTFRGPDKKSAYYPDSFLDLARIGAALGPNDILALRLHPFVKQAPVIPPDYRDRIVDLGSYPEFNHLLLACDLLVTDYSSAIFDYALLGRPLVFYVPDLAAYWQQHGFYYPFTDYTYGPVVDDLDSLLAALTTARVDQARLERFRHQFLNRCDGRATQRFLETVLPDDVTAATPRAANPAREGVLR